MLGRVLRHLMCLLEELRLGRKEATSSWLARGGPGLDIMGVLACKADCNQCRVVVRGRVMKGLE